VGVLVARNGERDIWRSKNVDLAAPGDNILSTYLGGGYKVLSGTSMASPMTAGVAALPRARNSDASYSTIRKTIRNEVDLLPAFSGNIVSGGRLNTNKTAQDRGLASGCRARCASQR
jgi:subtilisin family serine protease